MSYTPEAWARDHRRQHDSLATTEAAAEHLGSFHPETYARLFADANGIDFSDEPTLLAALETATASDIAEVEALPLDDVLTAHKAADHSDLEG